MDKEMLEAIGRGLQLAFRESTSGEQVAAVHRAMLWLDAQLATPKPDWSQAPEWVRWAAVNNHGRIVWFEDEPALSGFSWRPKFGPGLWEEFQHAKLPIGIDFRTTLRSRPQGD